MNITIVLGAFFPVPPIMGGAVEKQWFALGKDFARRGHHVVQISRAMPQFAHREVIDGVQHLRVRGYDAPRSLAWLKFLDLLYSLRVRRNLPAAEIVVTNTFWLPVLGRRRDKGKMYVHVARMPKGQMRFYKRVARLQAVSQAVARNIVAEAPGLKTKVTVIPNGLPNELSNSQPPPLSARENILLYVGRVHPEKGLHLLIDALARLSPQQLATWRLVVVGPADARHGGGGEAYLQQLQQRATSSALQVEWTGAIFDEAELARQYRRAKIFVYPSLAERGESFGVAPLEAMAHGCAVIVSQLECFADVVGAGESAIVFDHRASEPAAALASEINRLINDPALLARIAAGGKEQARRFSISEIATHYLSDFEQLLAECS